MQSLLDQGQEGEQDQIPDELGTGIAVEGSVVFFDNPKSPSAGYYHLLLYPLP